MSVRPFQDLSEEERRECAARLYEAFGDEFSRQGVSEDRCASFLAQTFQAHNGLLTAWDDDGRALATAGYYKLGSEVYLCNVWTAPRARGAGTGSRMIAEVESAVAGRHRGTRELKLWCDAALVPFYERRGYVWRERARAARDLFVEVMAKDLRAGRRPEAPTK